MGLAEVIGIESIAVPVLLSGVVGLTTSPTKYRKIYQYLFFLGILIALSPAIIELLTKKNNSTPTIIYGLRALSPDEAASHPFPKFDSADILRLEILNIGNVPTGTIEVTFRTPVIILGGTTNYVNECGDSMKKYDLIYSCHLDYLNNPGQILLTIYSKFFQSVTHSKSQDDVSIEEYTGMFVTVQGSGINSTQMPYSLLDKIYANGYSTAGIEVPTPVFSGPVTLIQAQ